MPKPTKPGTKPEPISKLFSDLCFAERSAAGLFQIALDYESIEGALKAAGHLFQLADEKYKNPDVENLVKKIKELPDEFE